MKTLLALAIMSLLASCGSLQPPDPIDAAIEAQCVREVLEANNQ